MLEQGSVLIKLLLSKCFKTSTLTKIAIIDFKVQLKRKLFSNYFSKSDLLVVRETARPSQQFCRSRLLHREAGSKTGGPRWPWGRSSTRSWKTVGPFAPSRRMASSLSRSSLRLRLRRYLPFPGLGSDRLSVLSRGGEATSRRSGKISNSCKRETFCDSLQLFTPMLKTLTSSHSKLVNVGKVAELSTLNTFFLFIPKHCACFQAPQLALLDFFLPPYAAVGQ